MCVFVYMGFELPLNVIGLYWLVSVLVFTVSSYQIILIISLTVTLSCRCYSETFI